MKEHPILFTGEMVNAILENRKTQTRRIIKPQPEKWVSQAGYTFFCDKDEIAFRGMTPNGPAEYAIKLKYQKGDHLWVKEGLYRGEWEGENDAIYYQADNTPAWDMSRPATWVWNKNKLPSMFCPYGLSRITLEVTRIYAERVQEISEADAIAEGIKRDMYPIDGLYQPQQLYAELWDSINAKRGYGWDVNPWVWVIEFRRIS